ncbi:hypothetical protein RJT34_03222 [Clitoria ternatea]|uniref:Uncharacterized protein n=1 Tax=Clitoria ternatea TaxID=43366 RepID=A0AAN9KMK4_CLITE
MYSSCTHQYKNPFVMFYMHAPFHSTKIFTGSPYPFILGKDLKDVDTLIRRVNAQPHHVIIGLDPRPLYPIFPLSH